MKNTNKKSPLLISVDVDSPLKLLTFHRINNVNFDLKSLEEFYETSFDRALSFFDEMNIKATFFVVGEELENSKAIQNVILKAHNAGHEIENHTYSHPFGLASLSLDLIRNEITECNRIIEQVTGRHPIGFRSPGYSINSKVLEIVRQIGLKYDSSAYWSIMNPVIKYGHKYIFKNGLENEGFGEATRKIPQKPYFPNSENWLKPDDKIQSLLELPLPRTKIIGMPFYNNFNLLTPKVYTRLVTRKIKKPCLVYLLHIIEFMDLSDNIPGELIVHPNLKIPVSKKIDYTREIISTLCNRYELTKTSDLINQYMN